MANKTSTFLSIAFVLSLLLIITISESRSIFGVASKSTPTLTCDTVVGVESGDTCFDIAKANNLTTTTFDAINPNLNCTALFVGQWICIDGSMN